MNKETFHESYGLIPVSTLRVIRNCNVSPADWEGMLMRWGFHWGQAGLPFPAIENHIITHAVNGSYRYPMYED